VNAGYRRCLGHGVGQIAADMAGIDPAVAHWLTANLVDGRARRPFGSVSDAVSGEPFVEVARIIANGAPKFEKDGTIARAAKLIQGGNGESDVSRGAANRQCSVVILCDHCLFRAGGVAGSALKMPRCSWNCVMFLRRRQSPLFLYRNGAFPHHFFGGAAPCLPLASRFGVSVMSDVVTNLMQIKGCNSIMKMLGAINVVEASV